MKIKVDKKMGKKYLQKKIVGGNILIYKELLENQRKPVL